MKKLLLLHLGMLAMIPLYGQTYTTIADGNWNSASIWADGNIPPSGPSWTGPVKDITVNHNVSLPGNISLGQGYVRNITVGPTGILTLGSFQLLENAEYNPTLFTVDGSVTANSLTIAQSATLAIGATGSVTVAGPLEVNWNSSTLTNEGNLTVQSFKNQGTFVNSGALVVSGNFENHYDFSATFGGTTTIGGNLTSNGDMAVPAGSTLSVGGSYYLHDNKTADIDGAFEVEGDVVNRGTIDGDGYMVVNGITSNENVIFGLEDDEMDCTIGCGAIVLPVQILHFSVTTLDKRMFLKWQTASETNNDFFTIEKSADGRLFTEVAKIPGSGTTHVITTYEWVDHSPVGSSLSFYRLKQTDYDGTSETLGIVSISADHEQLTIMPNPVAQNGVLYVQGAVWEKANWAIYTLDGKKQLQGLFDEAFAVPVGNIARGQYLLAIENSRQRLFGRFIVD